MSKRFNVRALFDASGLLSSLEYGDFGSAEGDPGPLVDHATTRDQLVSWPCDPAMTGATNIASLVGWKFSPAFRFIEGVR